MEREPAIRRLTIRNLLSFGEEDTTIDLQNLNVLIGANGSGKSNLIEVIGLLQNAPKELATAINNGGPVDEWLWKGAAKTPTASIEAIVTETRGPIGLRYFLAFTKVGFRFEITAEAVQKELSEAGQLRPFFYYRREDGRAYLTSIGAASVIEQKDINPQLSILAERKDPEHYPEITDLGGMFGRIQLYRDWEFGTLATVREPCDVSLQSDYLEEDGSNLGVVLSRLLGRPPVKDQIIELLQTFYENTKDLRTTIEGGRMQTRLEEKGLNTTIPLIPMSDGTSGGLRYLLYSLSPTHRRWCFWPIKRHCKSITVRASKKKACPVIRISRRFLRTT
jgi:predicted ATPase